MTAVGQNNIRDYYDEVSKVIKMPNRDEYIPPQGMGYLMFEAMKKHFGKTALIDIVNRETDTYDDLFRRAVRTAIKLKEVGIKPGDIISIFSHNQIDSISVFLSAFFIGAINASLDPVLPDDDLEYLIPQVCPKIFFVSTNCEKRLEELCKKVGVEATIIVFGESDHNLRYADFRCPQEGEDSFEPYVVKSLDDLCLLMFSSGTTGLPKAMCFSHRFYGYHSVFAQSLRNWYSLANLYWVGSIIATLSQIRYGNTYTFATKFDPISIWDDIKTFNITYVQLHPHVALEFIEAKPENWDGELACLGIAGSAIAKENMLKLRKALPNTRVSCSYGMSETVGLMNAGCPISYRKCISVGIPEEGIHYKIVDPETEQNLGFYQQGELRVKSPYQLTSYYKRDSSCIWDEEGYLKTGDVAYFDKDFSFFIVDRVKEIFKYKGVHIAPVKYEKLLESHPDIRIAVLIGVPHKTEGSHILAVVVPRKGSNITPKEIEDYYNERVIENVKIRLGVKFMEEIPMTVTGKIARKRLQDMILEEIRQ